VQIELFDSPLGRKLELNLKYEAKRYRMGVKNAIGDAFDWEYFVLPDKVMRRGMMFDLDILFTLKGLDVYVNQYLVRFIPEFVKKGQPVINKVRQANNAPIGELWINGGKQICKHV